MALIGDFFKGILTVIGIVMLIKSCSNNSEKEKVVYPSAANKPKECEYLEPLAIETGSYKDDASEEYEKVCFSNYIGIGDSKQNDMAYYAYGNSSEKIEKVVLTLGITEKSDEVSTLDDYQKYAAYLFEKYTGKTLSKKYLYKIKHHQRFSTIIGSYSLSMQKNGDNSQYGLVTEIKKIK